MGDNFFDSWRVKLDCRTKGFASNLSYGLSDLGVMSSIALGLASLSVRDLSRRPFSFGISTLGLVSGDLLVAIANTACLYVVGSTI